jgi:hypothetical protein
MARQHTHRVSRFGSLGVAYAGYRIWRRRGKQAGVVEETAAVPAPLDEVDPHDLTSPGTVSDPELEERRAAEAAERERESRASSVTKFEELRQEEEAERAEHSSAIAIPRPVRQARGGRAQARVPAVRREP